MTPPMDQSWATRLQRTNWLPPAIIIAAVTLLFWDVLLEPASAWVGDGCMVDFQTTVGRLWLLQFHHYDFEELSRTVYLTYPAPVNLVSELGFLLDISLLVSAQVLFGQVLGYNIGVWLILVCLALAVYRCARCFELTPWFAAIASIITLSAQPIAEEVANGRHYQLLAVATATLCVAEWPKLVAGHRFAAVRCGIWLAVTVLAHAFTGQLVGVFILGVAVATLVRSSEGARGGLVEQLLWMGGATVLLASGPAIMLASHLPVGEESIGMLSGYEAYYLKVHRSTELLGVSPVELMRTGMLRILPLALAATALLVKSRRATVVFFLALFVGALLVVWGPYQRIAIPIPGSETLEFSIPLPYLALRAVLPYFWRMLWLIRVVLFANVALGVLAAVTLSWAYWALRNRLWQARAVVGLAIFLSLAQSVAGGSTPLVHTHVLEATEDSAETAALMARIRNSPEVKAVFLIEKALHLQMLFERPVSMPKWIFAPDCNGRTLRNCGLSFAGFVEMPESSTPAERIRLGLCYLEERGVTHLLFAARKLQRPAGNYSPESEAALDAEEDRVKAVLRQVAKLVDQGGGSEFYELQQCAESPKAKGAKLPDV